MSDVTNLVITKIERPYSELFSVLAEVTEMGKISLFKSMLHNALTKFLEQRHELMDVDPIVLEHLEHEIETLFGTVFYSGRYCPMNNVPEDKRQRVVGLMEK